MTLIDEAQRVRFHGPMLDSELPSWFAPRCSHFEGVMVSFSASHVHPLGLGAAISRRAMTRISDPCPTRLLNPSSSADNACTDFHRHTMSVTIVLVGH